MYQHFGAGMKVVQITGRREQGTLSSRKDTAKIT
jgi:hypothetical protein